MLRYWLPAIAWSAVLLLMSGNAGASSVTAGFLEVFIAPSNPRFELVHFLFRKTGHVVAYGLLGFLDFRAVRGRRAGWTFRWSATAVVLAIAVAALDEWHQSFFPSRTGVPSDVVVDACGAMLAQSSFRASARNLGGG